MRASLGVVLVFLASSGLCPRDAHADDFWGPDKALHFGVSVGLSIGGYAASSLVLEEPWQRALAGALFSLSIGGAKEGYDARVGGEPSWKDFAWDAIGTTVGISVAFAIDVTLLAPSTSP